MGWESTNVTGKWNGSGTGPVACSHHRANRTLNTGARLRYGTVPVSKLWCEHGLRELLSLCDCFMDSTYLGSC